MKKIIPVLVALILIIAIGGATVGSYIMEKYSYSDERVDLKEYYQVTGEQAAIVLQDEIIDEKAIIRNGNCYLALDTVHKYLNEGFYVDTREGLLLYTTATETIRTEIGGNSYTNGGGTQDLGKATCYLENDILYLAADYVKLFTNFSYEMFDMRIQMYTEWGSRQKANIQKDTAIRERGGVKSAILRDLSKGEEVEILEKMETWCKVKSSDAVIGYVENKFLVEETTVEEIPVTDYVAPEYTSLNMEGKVSLGWHAIGGEAGNSTLDEMVAGARGMNVIAPTWFSLNDEQGNFRSFASAEYVARAHELGLQVWGVLDDFNYNNENNANLSVYNVLSSTTARQQLSHNIVNAALGVGMDGINLDFERVDAECGEHFIQFLRELSILCRNNGLILSVDNYVPFHFNDYYRLDIQGQVADYVIIMGYDEHWHGSGDPGSVASIDYVESGISKTLDQVPANKVVNGLPFYTILWKVDGATVTDEYLTIRNTADFLGRVGIQPQWDDVTCQNYAEWTSGTATYKIWLEDLESIRVKLNVMSAKEIGGVAVWRLGYGTPEIWELINAYASM